MNEIKDAYDTTLPGYENLGNLKLGFNELSDWSLEEFQKMNGIIKRNPIIRLEKEK
jgi:hypothetical protein